MKRCPECSFLYLDSDQLCDLDHTPLVADDFGMEVAAIEPLEIKAEKVSKSSAARKPKAQKQPPVAAGPQSKEEKLSPAPTGRKRKRKVSPKTLAAAIVASLTIGLALLFTYQRMRPGLEANQSATESQSQGSQISRVAQIAQQASNEATANGPVTPSESGLTDAHDNTDGTAQSTSTTSKTTPASRPESARVPVSSKPVSTSDVAESGRGPVTIQLADGTSLQAEEVWRTKAGIWYRRKGIVTFIKPNRVRSMSP
jgi:cytoskeletal protein RodZ